MWNIFESSDDWLVSSSTLTGSVPPSLRKLGYNLPPKTGRENLLLPDCVEIWHAEAAESWKSSYYG